MRIPYSFRRVFKLSTNQRSESDHVSQSQATDWSVLNLVTVILHVGTNNASTLRDNIPIRQCAQEIFDVMELLNSIYPQAEIWFSGILPRLDDDHKRGLSINEVNIFIFPSIWFSTDFK